MVISKRKSESALVYLLLFCSVDTILFGTNNNRLFLYVPRIIGVLFIAAISLINYKKVRWVGKEAWLLLYFLLLLLISGVVNQENAATVVSRIIAITSAYMLTKYLCIDRFVDVFLRFMYVQSITAILLEFLYYVVPSIVYALPLVTNTAGHYFRTAGICSIEVGRPGFCRAGGIFWEPGAFGVYLNVAMYFSLFVKRELSYKRVFAYGCALLITVSTTAYIALFILLCLFAMFGNGFKHRRVNQSVIAFSLIAILLLVVLGSSNLFNSLFGKIVNNESTTRVRLASFFGGLQIALDNPLFGVFATKIRPLMLQYQPSSGGMLTNTYTYIMAAYGILFFALFAYFTLLFFTEGCRSRLMKMGMVAFCLVLYISETFFSFFPFIFVFYSLRRHKSESSYY